MLTHPALLSAGINNAMESINKDRKDHTEDTHTGDVTAEGAGDQMDLSHRPTSTDVENLFDRHACGGRGDCFYTVVTAMECIKRCRDVTKGMACWKEFSAGKKAQEMQLSLRKVAGDGILENKGNSPSLMSPLNSSSTDGARKKEPLAKKPPLRTCTAI